MTNTLTKKLLDRGDYVAVEQGQVVIRPKSGKSAGEWLTDNATQIYREVLSKTGINALKYVSYSTGHYTQHKAGGVTLQYISLLTGESFHVVFNADLTRARGKQRGQPLPKGQFRVGKGHAFTLFWSSLELPLPRRLSTFHDCMGKLKPIVISGSIDEKNRINKASIKPITISHTELIALFSVTKSPDNYPTTSRQLPDKYPTRVPDKQSTETQIPQGLQSNSSACVNEYGLSNKGSTCNGSNVIPLPIQQSNEEWWADYDAGKP